VAYGDDAVDRNETWINATSPFEDLAEAALASEATAAATALDVAVAEWAAVAKALPAAAVAEYRRLLAELRKAACGDVWVIGVVGGGSWTDSWCVGRLWDRCWQAGT
jgi:hypothetical protein